MNKGEQIDWLTSEIKKVLAKAVSEFDFTVAEAVGVLEMVKLDVYRDAITEDDE